MGRVTGRRRQYLGNNEVGEEADEGEAGAGDGHHVPSPVVGLDGTEVIFHRDQ